MAKDDTERSGRLAGIIAKELNDRFPGQKPFLAEIKEDSFIFELDDHGNFSYYAVRYSFSPSGNFSADWDHPEPAVF